MWNKVENVNLNCDSKSITPKMGTADDIVTYIIDECERTLFVVVQTDVALI